MTALGVIGFQIMATHQVAHAVDRGFPPATVVWLFAFGGGCMMAGNLLGGWLSDRVGRGGVFALWHHDRGRGIGCLAAIRDPRDLLLLVVYTGSGFGFGMRIAQLSTIPADLFSGPRLGTILGVVQRAVASAAPLAPFWAAGSSDVTGSYDPAFAAAALTVTGSALAAWVATRPPATRWTRSR
jgi:MFS family permease